MKIGTRKFGEIEIDEGKILAMPEGLPGFDGYKKFVLLEDPKTAPFCWFQSVEEANLALVIMDPRVFKPDYEFGLEEILKKLGWADIGPENILIYVVINISGQSDDKQITANLMGPILINTVANTAIQVVLSDTGYSCQYNILNPEKSL